MKILCLDIGVGRHGHEIGWLVRDVFPALGITEYAIHGFEACREAYDLAEAAIGHLPGVHLHRLVICGREGEARLYHASHPDGHSVFPTKDNVIDADHDYEVVPCTRLSTWIRANVPDFPADVNILRFNVEGAEWPLFVDLDAEELLPRFQIVCGNLGGDITRVSELEGCYPRFLAIAKKHGVDMFWFCWDSVHDDNSKAEMTRRLGQLL